MFSTFPLSFDVGVAFVVGSDFLGFLYGKGLFLETELKPIFFV